MDPRSAFCPATRTFRSLRPPIPLPPADAPVSFPSFALSRLPSPLPAHPAFLDASTGAALSFPALLARVRSLAAALRGALGVAKGDVALVLAPPSLDVPVVYLAVLSIGAIVSPVSPLSTAADVARAVGLCNPSVVFATAATVGKVPAARKMTVVLLDSPQFESFLHGHELAWADELPPPPVEVRQSDVAVISYSSGTTGRTKAVAQSHRRLMASSLQVPAARPRAPGGGHVVTLLGVPMFHSYGLHMLMRGVVTAETTAVVTAPPRGGGAAAVLAAAARCGATRMFVAPPVVVAMQRGGIGPEGFPDLVRVDCGGAPLSPAAASAFHERFPDVELSLALGSTEGGLISNMAGHQECHRIKSTGRLCSGVEAKVVDIDSGELLPINEQGELCIRGPGVMLGYVGVDRLKDLIKYKAYQIAPAELEDVLHLIPGIFDAAVIPYPDEEAGQIPVAFVARQKGSNNLTEDQVMEFVAHQVAPYKKIRRVVFVDSIPRLPSGKLLRRELLRKHSTLPKSNSRL
ncbi:4-coumarate--CoA ligase-like 7 isoform X2 [Setaria italica]|uniref:4-coumarate--CoA ligase-like 7 isoform X2 n=1 Tax=Setaria italica TaxID=4555 RepID=UPI0006466388|nr:4-coumarate--CoA ligase-like 7 isoform X2 [Setaria italica]